MTVDQVAAALGRPGRTVRWWLKNGLMAGERVGRDWMIPVSEVERLRLNQPRPGRPRKTPGVEP